MASLEVPLRDILPDRSLAYHDGLHHWSGAADLTASIRRCGVIRPVVLRERDRGFQTIGGFRRLEVLRDLGYERAPSLLVSGEIGDLFLHAVEEHAGQQTNLRERLRAIQAGVGLGWSIEEVSHRLLPALGLQPNPQLASEHLRLSVLPESLLDLLVEKRFSLRRCLLFCSLDVDDAGLLARICRHLRLGGRQIEQVCTYLLEIAGRDGLPLQRVVDELRLLADLDSKHPDRGVSAALLRIEERRMPETSKRRRELDRLCQGLADTGVGVWYDRDFTSDDVELVLSVSSIEQLRRELQALEEDRAQRRLQHLLAKISCR